MNIREKVYEYLAATGQPVKKLVEQGLLDDGEICQIVLGCSPDVLTDQENWLMIGAMRGDWGIEPREKEERDDLLHSWDVRFRGDHIDIMVDPPSPVTYWGKHKVVCSREIVRLCEEQNSLRPAADCKIKRLGMTLRELAIRCGVAE